MPHAPPVMPSGDDSGNRVHLSTPMCRPRRALGRRRLVHSIVVLAGIVSGGVVLALCGYLETGRALLICPACGARKSEFTLAFANGKLLTWRRPEHSDAFDFLHREIPPHECEWQPLWLAGLAAHGFAGPRMASARSFWEPVMLRFAHAWSAGLAWPDRKAYVHYAMGPNLTTIKGPLEYFPELKAGRMYPRHPQWNVLWLLHESSRSDIRAIERHWPGLRAAVAEDILSCPDSQLGDYRAALVLLAMERCCEDVIRHLHENWDRVNWHNVTWERDQLLDTTLEYRDPGTEDASDLLTWDPNQC